MLEKNIFSNARIMTLVRVGVGQYLVILLCKLQVQPRRLELHSIFLFFFIFVLL